MTRDTLVALVLGLAIIAGLIIAPFFLARYGTYILSLWAVTAIAAIGLNLTLGYAGQISLAQGAFVGIGAYTAAILTTTYGMPLFVAAILALVACFVIGWLLGYPALRVQHHYLAFITLAFSTLAWLVFRNEEWLTKGTYGIDNIPRPEIFGLSFNKPMPFYYLCLSVLGLVCLAFYGLIRSPWGRAFVALRENPLRAQSLGVDTRMYTLMAFAIGSALGGLSGVLYAPLVKFVDPNPFTLSLSLNLLLMVIVGGQGFFLGPLLGAMIAVLLPELFRLYSGVSTFDLFGWQMHVDFGVIGQYYLILYALFVMLLLVWSPTGLLGILDTWLTNRKTRAASAARASATATFTKEA